MSFLLAFGVKRGNLLETYEIKSENSSILTILTLMYTLKIILDIFPDKIVVVFFRNLYLAKKYSGHAVTR